MYFVYQKAERIIFSSTGIVSLNVPRQGETVRYGKDCYVVDSVEWILATPEVSIHVFMNRLYGEYR